MHTEAARHRLLAYTTMAATPLFFSTNLIFGRGVVGEVAPFTLAFIRWSLVALFLAPFAWRERQALATIAAEKPYRILLLGFLGMWMCGAVVYLGLSTTSAINGTLIYTTSPLFILLIEALFCRAASACGKASARSPPSPASSRS